MNVTEVESKYYPGTTERTETVKLSSYNVKIWSDKCYLGMTVYVDDISRWNMLLSSKMADIIRSELILARWSDVYRHETSLGAASSMDQACYHVKAERNRSTMTLTFRDSVAECYKLDEKHCKFSMELYYFEYDKLARALLNAIIHKAQYKKEEYDEY